MFVEKSSVDLSKNKFENITLLWDMNELFEEFIYQVIRKHNIADVSAQAKKRLLTCSNSTYRDTKVDILMTTPRKVIIDTKYKKFHPYHCGHKRHSCAQHLH
jgi:5-methylcytosine-specific restriction endonuclease McrBC regulatory subunit McrC